MEPTEETSVPPKTGTYRVTINGLYVRSESWDHAFEVDGKGDEVYIDVQARTVGRMARSWTGPDAGTRQS